jgi:hypothetical protein
LTPAIKPDEVLGALAPEVFKPLIVSPKLPAGHNKGSGKNS